MVPVPVRLFEPDCPSGFHYRPDFITPSDEAALVAAIGTVTFADFEMRGVVAKRRVAFFGESYDGGAAALMPAFLLPLRAAVAEWAQVEPVAFAMALINEYRAGAPIGWHRDAPQYDIVTGVSLVASCRMKFRPYSRAGVETSAAQPRRRATHEITLEPRSAYLISGSARMDYEHHIPPVDALRYSITFRTLRATRP
jgi:2OG-Fe(II) oxygenase superfamily